MAKRFLILHGLSGSGIGHWQVWIARRLRAGGAWVSFPELPDNEEPRLAAWQDVLDGELDQLAAGGGERVILTHSLGAVLWLWHTRRIDVALRPDRVLLVAPPCTSAEYPQIAEFLPPDTDRDAVAFAAGETRLVCSDDDPHCPGGAAAVYAEPLGLEVEVIPGAGHLNTDAGYGPWPHLEAWCLGKRPGVAW